MRLLTHNLLMCNAKNCKGGFPLNINLAEEEMEEPTQMLEVEFNAEFIKVSLNKRIESKTKRLKNVELCFPD